MNLWHLLTREILHRKLNFVLGLVSVVVAVSCVVGVITLIAGHEARTAAQVKRMDDQIRKTMKNMGFNVMILPKNQNLAEFYAEDFAAKMMPESYVHKIAESRDVITVNHLRPALIRKMEWPEQKRQIVLMGVEGVVPFVHRNPKKPLANPVPEGKIDIGSVLASQLDLKPGSDVTFMGESFQVNKVNPARGNKDDITVWMDLDKVQAMLNLPDQINMIQALECNCASIDRLAEIEAEITAVLGSDVQIIELSGIAIARAKARVGVEKEGKVTIARMQRFAAIIVPIVILGSAVWIAALSLSNARQRRQEIGILRAIGMRSGQIMMLFLSKAIVIGLVGSIVGYALGFGIVAGVETGSGTDPLEKVEAASLFSSNLLMMALLLTPIISALAAWLPALSAGQQDPADVLAEE